MVGCGDIGIRLARRLSPEQCQCFGLRREPTHLPDFIQGIACDLTATDDLSAVLNQDFDFVVVMLVPAHRTDEGYKQAYVTNFHKVLQALEAQTIAPKALLLVSSTSVYGQSDGEWINEDSPAQPEQFSGQRVLEGEQLLAASPLASSIVRFSGIYGPGRNRLIKQVQNGDRGQQDHGYSNRIHADDCAGVLAHLLAKAMNGDTLAPCYIASDCEPVLLSEVKQWLAQELGLPANTDHVVDEKSRLYKTVYQRGNKRCDNARLLASGYEFLYPGFRDGYGQLMPELREIIWRKRGIKTLLRKGFNRLLKFFR